MSRYNYTPLQKALLSLTICILAFLPSVQTVHAQTKIGGSAGPGNASAVLELESTAQGLLPPRMTTTQRDAISNPAEGLTIYNITTNCIQVYKGAANGGWFDFCNTSGGSLSFTNCSSPTISGSFALGQAASVTITLDYNNSTGQSLGAFSSNTVNGITLSAPGGAVTALTAPTGSIILTASGTPTASGNFDIPVVLAGAACNIPVTVTGCSDPGATAGSTGCVVFTYRGQQVVYPTVRAKDGKIWLQKNLGATQVATATTDAASFGDLFQWGRWDDGHQLRTSTWSATAPSPNNPSAIASGSASFYRTWWSGGTTADSWTNTTPDATHGKDPCAAIGSGWHMPASTEWASVFTSEAINGLPAALSSNLKMAASGFRDGGSSGSVSNNDGSRADYWTATVASGAQIYQVHINNVGTVSSTSATSRYQGHAVRCLK